MTFFDVITFAEQGVYDVIANIGSLPARLVFQQIEESGYLLFTQKIIREKSPKEQNRTDLRDSSEYLKNLIKLMTIIGLILLIFGYNYSELALLIYGGQKLSEDLGTVLLQWHCVYILFIAVNGITECFTFAAMNNKQINSFNRKMITLSLVFLIASYLMTKWLGSQGFIIANCLNMVIRIVIRYFLMILKQLILNLFVSLKFIDSYYGNSEVDVPLKGSLPCSSVLISLVITFVFLHFLRVSHPLISKKLSLEQFSNLNYS